MKYLIIPCIIYCTCFVAFGQSYFADRELLWEISGNGLKQKSYLFGSLHSNDKRLFQLADSVYTAMIKTDKLILETDIFELFNREKKRVVGIFFFVEF